MRSSTESFVSFDERATCSLAISNAKPVKTTPNPFRSRHRGDLPLMRQIGPLHAAGVFA